MQKFKFEPLISLHDTVQPHKSKQILLVKSNYSNILQTNKEQNSKRNKHHMLVMRSEWTDVANVYRSHRIERTTIDKRIGCCGFGRESG